MQLIISHPSKDQTTVNLIKSWNDSNKVYGIFCGRFPPDLTKRERRRLKDPEWVSQLVYTLIKTTPESRLYWHFTPDTNCPPRLKDLI
jgi:hypothetical protein